MRATLFVIVTMGIFAGCGDDDSPAPTPDAARDADSGNRDGMSDAPRDAPRDTASDPVMPADAQPDVTSGMGEGQACDPAILDCREGLKCIIDVDGASKCYPVPASPLASGADCTFDPEQDPCTLDEQCVTLGGAARCRKVCNFVERSGCEGDEECIATLNPTAGPGWCLEPPYGDCGILSNSDCAVGQACVGGAVLIGVRPIKLCALAGTAGHGDRCATAPTSSTPADRLCAAGSGCFEDTTMGEGECRTYCNEVAAGMECPGGSTCMDGEDFGLTGDDSIVGVCVP